MTRFKVAAALLLSLVLALSAGCSSDASGGDAAPTWVDEEVTFEADGLTLHGTYRHRDDDQSGPAALLISESGNTDRNGDNAETTINDTLDPPHPMCKTGTPYTSTMVDPHPHSRNFTQI